MSKKWSPTNTIHYVNPATSLHCALTRKKRENKVSRRVSLQVFFNWYGSQKNFPRILCLWLKLVECSH